MIENTYVIIVTYGNRKVYLEKVLDYFSDNKSVQIILVNNNSSCELSSLIEETKTKIHLINSSHNKGSAWGFKTGIQYAILQADCAYIWLLDDDNLPEKNVLAILTDTFTLRVLQNQNNNFALMPVRSDRKYLKNVADGQPVHWNFPMKNAFLGFHLFKLHYFLFRKMFRITTKQMNDIIIPCAPYGGLFFHKNLIQQIGLPDERFFVYADDFEFTYRITYNNGSIMLVPGAVVNDLEKTWQIKQKGKILSPNILIVDNNKVYFSTRNYLYFQKKFLIKSELIFRLNKIIYSAYLSFISHINGKRANYKRFRDAVNDGLGGNFDNNKYRL